MAKKQPPQPEIIMKMFRLEEIKSAFSKIQRRIDEVERLRTDKVRYDDKNWTLFLYAYLAQAFCISGFTTI